MLMLYSSAKEKGKLALYSHNNMRNRLIFVFAGFLISITSAFSQFEGLLLDQVSNQPIVGADIEVVSQELFASTNASGVYRFPSLKPGTYTMRVITEDYGINEFAVTADDFGTRYESRYKAVEAPELSIENDIAVITDLEILDDSNAEVASLLTASRDPFNNVAAFNFRAARFRIRGYDNTANEVYINGVYFNSLSSGRTFFGAWGGLNDMFRSRDETEGLQPGSWTIGNIAGASNIDLRASGFRKQLRASYSAANASYRNRAMLTWGSGVSDNGWAFGASVSRRWSETGFVQGTFYDGFSGFFGVEKIFGDNHSIGLSVFSVNTKRGRSSASTQEAYDLVGDNFYNPNWGYLNGEVRNPRQYRNNLHTALLRYDNRINKSSITSTIGLQVGKDGSSGIDWYDAPDPRPDYYRNLPSFSDSPDVRELAEEYLSSNPDLLQLDLESMYEINANRIETIQSVDGIAGNDITGKFAAYKIQEQRYDPTKVFFNTTVNTAWSDKITTNSGINFTMENVDNFKIVDDLMGADFSVDWDNFADASGDLSILVDPAKQNNVLEPNNILYEGDLFGYHYHMQHMNANAWTQVEYSLNRLDFYVAGGVDFTTFVRDGIFQNGRFPDNSLGKGERKSYTTGTAKAGATFKLNGRNYFYASAAYITEAPYSRNSYVTARTRETLIEGLDIQKITSGEIGYIARFPGFKARATAYYTEIHDQFETRNVYFDQLNEFGNLIVKDIDTRHMGIEVGIDARLTPSFDAAAGIALGDHRYTSNPNVSVAVDDLVDVRDLGTTYFKNRFVSNGPQTALTAELTYNNKKFWSLSLGANYFDKNYISMSPVRRLESTLGDLIVGPLLSGADAIDATSIPNGELEQFIATNGTYSDLYDDVFGQEEYPNAITFDAFFRKSWKKDKYYIQLLGSVNNILNNTFRSGGFEQLRLRYRSEFDANENLQLTNLFPPRYYYAYGTTYFITLSVSYN